MKFSILILITAILSGCGSTDNTVGFYMTPEKRSELTALAYEKAAIEAEAKASVQNSMREIQASRAGSANQAGTVMVEGESMPVYRVNGVDKIYAVNRYVDPADPRVLHERHVIVRQESSPKWLTQAPATNQVLIGPTVTDSSMQYQPAVIREEMAVELARQREENANLREQTDAVLMQSEKMLGATAYALATAKATAQRAEAEVEAAEAAAAAAGAGVEETVIIETEK